MGGRLVNLMNTPSLSLFNVFLVEINFNETLVVFKINEKVSTKNLLCNFNLSMSSDLVLLIKISENLLF